MTRIIETDGGAIQVAESGDGEPALVFLHDWGGAARTWQITRATNDKRAFNLLQQAAQWALQDVS